MDDNGSSHAGNPVLTKVIAGGGNNDHDHVHDHDDDARATAF